MWRRRRSPLMELSGVARHLARRPGHRERDGALAQLGGAFCDVELPEYPMPLSDADRRRVTVSAASDLAQMLRSAHLRKADPSEITEGADALWREIAAANWDVVEAHEATRTVAARRAVLKVAAVLGAKASAQTGEQVPVYAVLQAMLAELESPGSVLAEQLRSPLAAMGVGLPHARRALLAELALTGGLNG